MNLLPWSLAAFALLASTRLAVFCIILYRKILWSLVRDHSDSKQAHFPLGYESLRQGVTLELYGDHDRDGKFPLCSISNPLPHNICIACAYQDFRDITAAKSTKFFLMSIVSIMLWQVDNSLKVTRSRLSIENLTRKPSLGKWSTRY